MTRYFASLTDAEKTEAYQRGDVLMTSSNIIDVASRQERKLLIVSLKNIVKRVGKNNAPFYISNLFVKLLENDCLNENGINEVKGYLAMMGE